MLFGAVPGRALESLAFSGIAIGRWLCRVAVQNVELLEAGLAHLVGDQAEHGEHHAGVDQKQRRRYCAIAQSSSTRPRPVRIRGFGRVGSIQRE